MMKIIQITSIVVGGVIALALLIALFVHKDYSLSREIVIKKPKSDVFSFVKLLKNQSYYSVWNMRDPNMKKSFTGQDGTPGFLYTWDGNKEVGKGEQKIASVMEGEKINYDLHFIKPFEGVASSAMTTKQISENETKVIWDFQSQMNYPMNLMLLFVDMDNLVGKDIQTGLENLKGVLEKTN